MIIKPVHIDFSEADIEGILEIIQDKLRRGVVSQSDCVDAFESAFAAYTQSAHAIAVSSGSAAIEIGLRAQNIHDGTVLVPANTNFATYSSTERAGARVRLVDIDLRSLAPSVGDLEAAYDDSVVGVVIVHMGGIISHDIKELRAWCNKKSIWLLEDCAHAHGSVFAGKHAGRFGYAGAFSFFATKVITSGEGGMLITDDPLIAEEARLYRNLGKRDLWNNEHIRMGTNARLSEFSALVGYTQLQHLDEFVATRRQIADVYTQGLANHPRLSPVLPVGSSSYYKYVVMIDTSVNRDTLKSHLRSDGVHLAGEIYEIPLHWQPILRNRHQRERFPKSEAYCTHHICLPIHTGMRQDQAQFVVDRLLYHVQ